MRIYSLQCPVSGLPRYIGKTRLSLKRRLDIHINEYRSRLRKGLPLTHKQNWFRSLERIGELLNVTIQLIEESPVEIVNERECFWIKEFRKTYGKKITNLTEGGDGVEMTPAICRKIAESKRGEKNPMFGKRFKRSPEQVERARLAMISSRKFQRSRKSKKYREKISALQRQKVLLVGLTGEVKHRFDSLQNAASFLGVTYANVKNARRDKRLVGRFLTEKFQVVYEKDRQENKQRVI